MTVDGIVGATNGAPIFSWDEEVRNFSIANARQVGCIVLGRKTAKDFIPHWSTVAADRNHPDFQIGKILTDTPKVVFSKKLKKSEWKNATIARGDVAEEIGRLKSMAKRDILVYGGGAFVSSLIEKGLIDEYCLLINPTALGRGITIFADLKKPMRLVLKSSKQFKCGIMLLCYEPHQG